MELENRQAIIASNIADSLCSLRYL